MMRLIATTACLLVLGIVADNAEAQEKKPPKITFDDHVGPVFRQKCASCHNPDKKSGDLDLTSYSGVMAGGGSGDVVEAGDSSASYLYSLITHESEPFMPPESPKIPDEMIETVRKWIDGGLLENKGSTAIAPKKKKFDLALQGPSTERPAETPMPPRLSLQPVTVTSTSTAIASLATNPWAPLAAVSGQKQILLYNTQTLELVGALPFPEGFPEILKFSRNGALLLAGGGRGGASGKVVVWDIRRGERIIEVGNELDTVLAADISSDQTLVALGGPQRVVRIYSTETGQLLHELRKHTDWIHSLEFSPDSVLLATGDRNGGLHVWEAYTGREYLTLKAHSNAVSDVSWRSDSNVLVSGSEDGSIRLWEMENGNQVRNWSAGGGVASIEFTRDGRIVSAGRDRLVKLWDQAGKQLRAFEAFGDLALEATFCDETSRVIGGDWSGEIRVWKSEDGARVGQLLASPPNLQSRLTAAQQTVTESKAAHAPLVTAYATAKDAADKIAAALTAAQAAEKTAKEAQAKATADVQTNTETKAKMVEAKKAADAIVAKLAPSVPMLADAVAKSEQAAKTLADDKEVAELAAKLKASLTKHSQTLKTQQETVAAKTKEIAAVDATIAKFQAAATEAAKQMEAAAKQVATLTPQVKPAMENAAKAKAAADAAAAQVADAEKAVQRWQDEIAFAELLAKLQDQRQKAEEALTVQLEAAGEMKEAMDSQMASTNGAKAKLAELQKVLTGHQAKTAELKSAIGTYQTNQTVAGQQRDAAKAMSAKLAPVIQSLQASLQAAEQAAKQSGNDKAIVEAAAAVTAVLKTKQAEKAQADAAATAKQKEFDVAAAALAKAQVDLKSAEAMVVAAKNVADTQAKVVAEEDAKLNAAKKAADEALAKANAAEQSLEKIQGEIAAAKGITAAAG